LQRGGTQLVFYDYDCNFDIEDPASSYSHSAILAAWFGGGLESLRQRAVAIQSSVAPDVTVPPILHSPLSRYPGERVS
jgi:hypothetical protein